ncbi:MAG: septal ring lytic transglycosylase RlpA family protein [Oceanicoccus sp.]
MMASRVWWIILTLTVAGCQSAGSVFEQKDGAPQHQVSADTIVDATPRKDAVTRAGNKNPYTVLGKTYHLLPTSTGYNQRGVASWYGTKFQGRPTANGEPYNLYGMTAAHRTLPIPAYVRVTNLDNNRTAIVRVNDRGPFHSDRIIDLSYAAAVKLGYAEKGTARVLVETIEADTTPAPVIASAKAVAPAPKGNYFLQIAAFRDLSLANKLRAELLTSTEQSVAIKPSQPAGFYRVQLGPIATLELAEKVSEKLVAMNFSQPQLIRP